MSEIKLINLINATVTVADESTSSIAGYVIGGILSFSFFTVASVLLFWKTHDDTFEVVGGSHCGACLPGLHGRSVTH